MKPKGKIPLTRFIILVKTANLNISIQQDFGGLSFQLINKNYNSQLRQIIESFNNN